MNQPATVEAQPFLSLIEAVDSFAGYGHEVRTGSAMIGMVQQGG
jgi:hypothetical protein